MHFGNGEKKLENQAAIKECRGQESQKDLESVMVVLPADKGLENNVASLDLLTPMSRSMFLKTTHVSKSKILALQNGCISLISLQIADAQRISCIGPCNHQSSLRLVLSCLCELKPCLDISDISLQHFAIRTGLFGESLHPLVKKDISTHDCGMAPKSQVSQAKLDTQKHS